MQKATKLCSEVADLREGVTGDRANVALIIGVLEEVLAMEEAVAEFLSASEMSCSQGVVVGKKSCLSMKELLLA